MYQFKVLLLLISVSQIQQYHSFSTSSSASTLQQLIWSILEIPRLCTAQDINLPHLRWVLQLYRLQHNSAQASLPWWAVHNRESMMCLVLMLLLSLIVNLTKWVTNMRGSWGEMEHQGYDQGYVVVRRGLSQSLSQIVVLLHQNTPMLILQSWCSIGFGREISML